MKELVRLRMRPSRDRKSFRYMLDYVDQSGKRRQIEVPPFSRPKSQFFKVALCSSSVFFLFASFSFLLDPVTLLHLPPGPKCTSAGVR